MSGWAAAIGAHAVESRAARMAESLRRDPGVASTQTIGRFTFGALDVAFCEDSASVSEAGDWCLIADLVASEGPDGHELLARFARRGWRLEALPGILDDLSGDFAGLIAHRSGRQLALFRDRLGVRPLFYSAAESALWCGSSIRTIRAMLDSPMANELSDESVVEFLVFSGPLSRERTIFEHIHRVAPRQVIQFQPERDCSSRRTLGALSVPARVVDPVPPFVAAERLRAALQASVRRRSRFEPFVALMSGGMDSTSVTAIASDILGRDAVSAHTVDYGVVDAEGRSEVHYAELVAEQLRIAHTVHSRDETLQKKSAPCSPAVPMADPQGTAQLRILANLASDGVREVWTGNGGDALFRASPVRFPNLVRRGAVGELWKELTSQAKYRRARPALFLRRHIKSRLQPSRGAPRAPGWIRRDWRERYDLDERLREVIDQQAQSDPFERLWTDPYWTNVQEFCDPMVLGLPLRLHSGFLDDLIIREVARFPDAYLSGKWLLREAFVGLLPNEIIERRKLTTTRSAAHVAAGSNVESNARSAWKSLSDVSRWIDEEIVSRARMEPEKITGIDHALLGSTLTLARWVKDEVK